jgi:hypothetical protein
MVNPRFDRGPEPPRLVYSARRGHNQPAPAINRLLQSQFSRQLLSAQLESMACRSALQPDTMPAIPVCHTASVATHWTFVVEIEQTVRRSFFRGKGFPHGRRNPKTPAAENPIPFQQQVPVQGWVIVFQNDEPRHGGVSLSVNQEEGPVAEITHPTQTKRFPRRQIPRDRYNPHGRAREGGRVSGRELWRRVGSDSVKKVGVRPDSVGVVARQSSCGAIVSRWEPLPRPFAFLRRLDSCSGRR